jgi:hypothetical protein
MCGRLRASGLPAWPGGQRGVRVDALRWDSAEELWRWAADASARQASPDWRVEEAICAARSNIAITSGAFADAARLAEQAAGIARAGGDLADASLELTIAAACHLLAGDAPPAVPLANEALALARQIGAASLVAAACSPWARPSSAPTRARPVPACAKAAS